MPPRVIPPQASMSPAPMENIAPNDAQDILVIQDVMDTLDQIPPELTRVHSDLNELGAVLYSTLVGLEKNLNKLIDWVQDPTITPDKRFALLQDIAEEAARYKLGGDDKIRVAGGACDGIMAHQRHISNLIASSTLFQRGPLSPYSYNLTLSQLPPHANTRRGQLARAVNSPFVVAPRAATVGASGLPEGAVRDTPSKKKKHRVQALGRDDDDASSVGGEKKRAPAKKRRQRAVSPADSLASTSAFNGKPSQPQTARQLAAAANKARKAERADESDDESGDEGRQDALGLDIGSREGSQAGGKSINATPVLANGTVLPAGDRRGSRAGRAGQKRSRADDEDGEEESDGDDVKPKRTNGSAPSAFMSRKSSGMDDSDALDGDGQGVDGDADTKLYCTCRQISYGEMIACDDEECEVEWYHIHCLGFDKPPEGNWICPQCVERRKKNPGKKRAGKAKSRR
ncbi:hypothetical protein BD324DRAFT_634571 [Kockovaella imperatae]|uniref:Chromatin modification-related protein n=1 Tax=Kockovaella imperatae TaxID=4999 RepID=A0A1Y1UC99_9TREE|nr:hypothetical protein BD324DRAFT_634571 [Kockovaella imperatae]ORX34705.1 hypothetical protein BD324DRAFT_634571 [Kockovaella imperatae]